MVVVDFVDDEFEAVVEIADVAVEPIVVFSYGCPGMKQLLCSHECRSGHIGIEGEVLRGLWWLLKIPCLVACGSWQNADA